MGKIKVIKPESGIVDEATLPPWGWGIMLLAQGIKPMPIANRNEIHKNAGRLRIHKDRKAEAYILQLRTTFMRAAASGSCHDEVIKRLHFPIPGKTCPLRIDILYLYSPEDRAHGELALADRDNLNKGTLDALKYGPTDLGIPWGLIDDDRYSPDGYTAKGEAPEGEPSAIMVIFSRSGIRGGKEMLELPRHLGPLPPYRVPNPINPNKIIPAPGPRILDIPRGHKKGR